MTSIDWASLRQSADDATQPAPPGEYNVTVAKAEHKIASTGSDMISMQLRIVGGPKDGKAIFMNAVLSTKSFALKRFFDTLDAFGIDGNWLTANNASLEMIAEALVGRVAIAEVDIRQWQGVDRNEIKALRSADGLGVSIDSSSSPMSGIGGLAGPSVGSGLGQPSGIDIPSTTIPSTGFTPPPEAPF